MKKLEKVLNENNESLHGDFFQKWKNFYWNETEYPLKTNLKILEEQLRNQVLSNDEEFKTQAEDISNLNNKLNEMKKNENNIFSKSIQNIINIDPKFDKQGEYLDSIYVIITKEDQLTYLKNNYENLVNDNEAKLEVAPICPNSLRNCTVKDKSFIEKNIRVFRFLCLKQGTQKIISKLKIKNYTVKTLFDEETKIYSKEEIDNLNRNISNKKASFVD